MPPQPLTPSLLLTLGALAAIGPLAIDLYLSTFPAMVLELGADATGIQLTLTGYLLGVAAGQLVFGPMSDRFGRRIPLIVGLALCVVASVAAALAPTLPFLVAARIVQGFGAASGAVIGRAIISDLASGDTAAKAISIMMLVGGIAPIIAPSLGSVIGAAFGWRGILATIAITVTALIVAVVAGVRESYSQAHRDTVRSEQHSHPRALAQLTSRGYLGNTLAMAFSTGVMMTYISASPFIYQEMMGFPPLVFGLLFGANATAMLLVNWWTARLIGRFRVRTILGAGVAVMSASCAAVVLFVVVDAPATWLIAPLFVTVGAVGAVAPKATAQAIGHVPRIAGTGSAVLGALQFGVGAAVTPLANTAGPGSAAPMAVVMMTCALVMTAGFLMARPGARA
ncbi:multidrug effflux MFS transporter [Microbacterium aurantiacum]|uniref:multidrug effflux MFS transporter n=1 Tax=Microbacterium aurantiacum TaxID=162393 RepID=UPI00260C5AE2|nr:multidrug effflux MFS transporter [Microbacterium aurantiacum]